MDQDNTQQPQTEAALAPVEAAPAPVEAAPAPVATAPTPVAPAPTTTETTACKCPTINASEWDKQKKQLDKTFYKTFSPRLFNYPLSFPIDLERAKQGAIKKGYKIPDNPMILDSGGMFWATLMLEVNGVTGTDSSVVSFSGKNLYTKVSKRPWKEIDQDIAELKTEMGSEPAELYFWWTSCPKCVAQKEVKAVLVAVEAATQPVPTPETPTPAPPAEPPATTPQTQEPAEPQHAPTQPTVSAEPPAPAPVEPAPPVEQPPQTPPTTPAA